MKFYYFSKISLFPYFFPSETLLENSSASNYSEQWNEHVVVVVVSEATDFITFFKKNLYTYFKLLLCSRGGQHKWVDQIPSCQCFEMCRAVLSNSALEVRSVLLPGQCANHRVPHLEVAEWCPCHRDLRAPERFSQDWRTFPGISEWLSSRTDWPFLNRGWDIPSSYKGCTNPFPYTSLSTFPTSSNLLTLSLPHFPVGQGQNWLHKPQTF